LAKGPPGINQYANRTEGQDKHALFPLETNKFGQPPIRCWKLIGNASRLTQTENGCEVEILGLEVKSEFGSWATEILALDSRKPRILLYLGTFPLNLCHVSTKVFPKFYSPTFPQRLKLKWASFKKSL